MIETAKPCGRQIHMASRALYSVRNNALGQAGIAFPYWVVLEVIAETPALRGKR